MAMGRPPIDDQWAWDQCKERIRKLYIEERRTRNEVKEIIAQEFNFRPSNSRYDDKFKEWGFRKSLSKLEWSVVNQIVGKRKLGDKESEVIVSGQRVDPKRLRRNVKRYRNHVHCNETTEPSEDSSIVVQTPPAQVQRFVKCQGIPWHQFRETIFPPFDSLQHQYWGNEQTFLAQDTGLSSSWDLDLSTIWDENQGYSDTFFTPSMMEFHELSASQILSDPVDLDWFPDPTGSTYDLAGPISFLEDIPHDTLISLLEVLAESHEHQQEDVSSARFHSILAKYGEQGSLQHAVTQYLNGYKLELTFQILRVCVKRASNNLLPDGTADKLVTWISSSGLSASLNQLLASDIPTVDAFKSQLLISASRLGLSSLVSFLIVKGADMNTRMGAWTGDTPLEAAILRDRLDVVEILLTAGARPDSIGAALYPPLYSALEQEHGVQMGELLIKYGADVREQPRSEKPILGEAIKHGKTGLVGLLLKKGADINAASYYRGSYLSRCASALQCAMWMNDANASKLLIEHGADVNASNTHHRSRDSHSNNEADSNPKVNSDEELCGANEMYSNEEMSAYDDFEGDEYLKTYLTPVQIACLCERSHLVQSLVEAGADLNACPWEDLIDDIRRKTEDRRPTLATALQGAVVNSNIDLARYLIWNGANVNAKGCPFTALQIAAGRSDLDMVKLLLDHGADVNGAGHGHGGRTALQAAAETGHLDLIDFLLHAGADVNAPACEHNGRTAFQAAAGAGHLKTANKLLPYGADINAPAGRINGRTCLQAAARGLHSDMVDFLLDIGADPNGLPAGSSGLTALQMSLVAIIETKAARNLDEGTAGNRPWIFPSLPDHSRDEEQKWREFFKISISLVKHRAKVNAPPSPDSVISTAGLAARSGSISCLLDLVGLGLDLNCYTDSSSAILEAVESRHLAILSPLLASNVDVSMPGISLSRSREHPITALAAAAAHGDVDMTNMLFAAGAKLESFDESRLAYTPLGLAAENLSVSLVNLLLEKGADPNELCWSDRYEHMMAPLFYIIARHPADIKTGSRVSEIATALLDAKADANFRCLKFDRTLLQAAVANNHLEIAQKLIEAGAEVDAPAGDYFGRTALQLAAEKGNMDMFQLLRRHDADVNAPAAAWRGVTALQAAAISGSFDMVFALLQDGANVSAAASEKGRHALEGAAEHGRLDTVVLLLENDDEPSTFHKRRAEAAERATHNGRNTIAKLLRERAASSQIT